MKSKCLQVFKCKNICGGKKERILIESRDKMKKELEITSIIQRLQTTEGLLREQLNIDSERWEKAMKKFSFH